MNRLIVLAVAAICSQTTYANCTPDKADARRDCNSCGNLEQNHTRGVDNVWNASFNRNSPNINNPMRVALRWQGFATVNLMHPTHSSPGVIFYRGILTDPSFRITNTTTYSEAVSLQAQLNLDPLQPGFIQMRTEIRNLLSSSTSTGTAPYTISVYDQDGNLITQEQVERGTGVLDRASFGQNDLNPDPRYQRSECIDHDPRYNGEESSSNNTGGGSGGPSGPPPRDPDPIVRCGYTDVDGEGRRRTCRRV